MSSTHRFSVSPPKSPITSFPKCAPNILIPPPKVQQISEASSSTCPTRSIQATRHFMVKMPEKKFHKHINPNKVNSGASNDTILGNLWNKYLAIPRKVRLYLGVSTFIVALGSDYYLTQQEKALAAKENVGSKVREKATELSANST